MKYFLISLLLGLNIYADVMEYKVVGDNESIYGTLNCKGSTNVEKLLKYWVSKFEELYPSVNSTMNFKGSGQGINALINGSANIGAASRKIKQKEIDLFNQSKGYAPTEIKVSLDALAIYVNRQNKIDKITLPQIDAIFSTSLKRGYKNRLESWKSINGSEEKISIYLYDKNSGTRSYFRKKVMKKGEFNSKNIVSDKYTKLSEVIDEVAKDTNGICFGSLGHKNYKVKALSISKKEYFPIYKPNSKNIKTRKYPLTRFFYIYLDVPPDEPIPKLLYEFCKYILSSDGQKVVSGMGGLTLSSKQVGIELSKIRRQ